MARSHWKLAAASASVALVVGCANLAEHPLRDRLRCRSSRPCATPCCNSGTTIYDGAVYMGDMGPILTTPGPAVMETPLGAPAPLAPNVAPPANGQRLVPQPQPQTPVQPTPFNPNPPR